MVVFLRLLWLELEEFQRCNNLNTHAKKLSMHSLKPLKLFLYKTRGTSNINWKSWIDKQKFYIICLSTFCLTHLIIAVSFPPIVNPSKTSAPMQKLSLRGPGYLSPTYPSCPSLGSTWHVIFRTIKGGSSQWTKKGWKTKVRNTVTIITYWWKDCKPIWEHINIFWAIYCSKTKKNKNGLRKQENKNGLRHVFWNYK